MINLKKDQPELRISQSRRSRLINEEIARAERLRPTIFDIKKKSPADLADKVLARCAGGWVEVTDELFMDSICPADLFKFPCPWDELIKGGCRMLRLCQSLEANNRYRCTDRPSPERCQTFCDENHEGARPCPQKHFANPKAGGHKCEDCTRRVQGLGPPYLPVSCPHLHCEVKHSCRFVIAKNNGDCQRLCKKGEGRCLGRCQKTCNFFVKKKRNCPAGHDFEKGRINSARCFEAHLADALFAGAQNIEWKPSEVRRRNDNMAMPQSKAGKMNGCS